jgi:uncharacterized protein (DUF1778 family)
MRVYGDRIHLRIPEAERVVFERAAAERGMSLSEFLRASARSTMAVSDESGLALGESKPSSSLTAGEATTLTTALVKALHDLGRARWEMWRYYGLQKSYFSGDTKVIGALFGPHQKSVDALQSRLSDLAGMCEQGLALLRGLFEQIEPFVREIDGKAVMRKARGRTKAR